MQPESDRAIIYQRDFHISTKPTGLDLRVRLACALHGVVKQLIRYCRWCGRRE